MERCRHCLNDTQLVKWCDETPIMIDGVICTPVRYGEERRLAGVMEPCGDCGVLPGSIHHHGCDLETCPRCRRQSIDCDCDWGWDDDDEEEAIACFGFDEFEEPWVY